MIGPAVERSQPADTRPGPTRVAELDGLPTIDVLLPAIGEQGAIDRAVQAVRSADYPADCLRLHVIVEATDKTKRAGLWSRPADDDLRLLEIPADYPGEPTAVRALNYGFSRTEAPLVGVVGPDDDIDPGLFREVAAVFANRDCDFALPRLNGAAADGWASLRSGPDHHSWGGLVPPYTRPGSPASLEGTPCFFRRAVLEEAAEARLERSGSPWTISERLWLMEHGYVRPVPWDPNDGAGVFELGHFLWKEGYEFACLDHATPVGSTAGSRTDGSDQAATTRPLLSRLWRALRGLDGAADPASPAADASRGLGAPDPAWATDGGPVGGAPGGSGSAPDEPPGGPRSQGTVRNALESGVASANRLDRMLASDPEDSSPSPAQADVATALIRAVEAGTITDDIRDRLADQLSDLLARPAAATPPPRVRMGAIEDRLQAAERVAGTLEAVVDRHGTAEAYLAEVRTELEEVETAAGTIQGILAVEARSQATLETALGEVEDDVDRLDRRLDLLDARLNALRAAHRSSVPAVRGHATSVADRLDGRERLGDEVKALWDAIAEVRARHAALVDALVRDEAGG